MPPYPANRRTVVGKQQHIKSCGTHTENSRMHAKWWCVPYSWGFEEKHVSEMFDPKICIQKWQNKFVALFLPTIDCGMLNKTKLHQISHVEFCLGMGWRRNYIDFVWRAIGNTQQTILFAVWFWDDGIILCCLHKYFRRHGVKMDKNKLELVGLMNCIDCLGVKNHQRQSCLI